MNYYMTLVERDNYRIKKMLDKSEKMKKINKMIKSDYHIFLYELPELTEDEELVGF